jgi:hypothetical protein
MIGNWAKASILVGNAPIFVRRLRIRHTAKIAEIAAGKP